MNLLLCLGRLRSREYLEPCLTLALKNPSQAMGQSLLALSHMPGNNSQKFLFQEMLETKNFKNLPYLKSFFPIIQYDKFCGGKNVFGKKMNPSVPDGFLRSKDFSMSAWYTVSIDI